jgi:hypothetical protein
MLDQFCYEEYDKLLSILKAGRKNLTFSDFRNPDIPPSFFILRHDIDRSLSAALKMAHIEAERSIRATYFLLLSSEHYNLLSQGSCKVPHQLAALGHEVGLHYDVRAMSERDNADLNTWLHYEIDILSALTGDAIRSIAMHNPSIYGQDPFAGDNHFVNAYDPQFTKAIAYYSDSCGAWRDHVYEVFQRSSIPDKLQLLIHPFQWAETPGDRWERLNKWIEEKHQSLEKLKKKQRKMWSSHAGVKEHESRLSRRST